MCNIARNRKVTWIGGMTMSDSIPYKNIIWVERNACAWVSSFVTDIIHACDDMQYKKLVSLKILS